MSVRLAGEDDIHAVADLHATLIAEGFLPTLGPRFLARLYRRMVRSPQSFVFVAETYGQVSGFAAATENVSALYRSFLLRDGVVSGLRAAPRLVMSWRRVLETLRYPTGGDGLPRAEVLAVAVSPAVQGQGVGRALVETVMVELGRRGVGSARVVAAAGNGPALGLYRACGFEPARRLQVHQGTTSEVLTWPSSCP